MYKLSSHLQVLLLNYLTPVRTDCLFLFDDNTFNRGILIDKANAWSFLQGSRVGGTWSKEGNSIRLFREMALAETLVFNKGNDCYTSVSGNITSFFYKIDDPDLIQEAIPLMEIKSL